jgi:hypothetical protein
MHRLFSNIFNFRSVAILTVIALAFFAQIGVNAQNRQLEQENNLSQKRIALVIGNGAYTKAKTLPNPANDAADMAQALKDLGFEVLSGTNLSKRQMEALIREFGAKLANSGGTGLFYYAGHGIQVGGENYLVPVEADIPEEDEVGYAAVPVSLVLTKMTTAKNDLNIVILDACRNNPFARSWRSFRDNSSSDGLAKISPPTGTLVLYATEPGKVASDGAGRNGLFTEALLKQIKKPNLEYDQMVKAVSADVWQTSNKKQLPWKEGNSLQDFYFVSKGQNTATVNKPTSTNKPAETVNNQSPDEAIWNAIKDTKERNSFIEFIRSFPNSKYIPQAQKRLKDLEGELTEQSPIKVYNATFMKIGKVDHFFVYITGMDAAADVRVFLNGAEITTLIKDQSQYAITLKGENKAFNIKIGQNETYVIVNGVKSNVYVFKKFE